ncbi:MAG: hypothetical protein ACRD0B_12460, partial [Acidimicrobiales bacterium]
EITWRECALMAPLVAVIVFLGVYPGPVLSRISPSVDALVAHVQHATASHPPVIGPGAALGARQGTAVEVLCLTTIRPTPAGHQVRATLTPGGRPASTAPAQTMRPTRSHEPTVTRARLRPGRSLETCSSATGARSRGGLR